MDAVLLSRIQFAFTVGFHFLFPPLTLGLTLIILIFETLHLRRNQELYKKLTDFFVKILALVFVIGTATGIVMEFSFGTNWSNYSRMVGDIFGAPLARRIIFAVMIPALLISYVISSLFYMGSWQGFGALAHFNLFVARIATASFMAYALGQILDVHVFNRLRQSRRWWLAPTASTLFGNVSDTLAFFFIAFWRSPDAFMAEHWMEIALVDYCFKVLISIVFFLPMYGVLLNMLLKRLADKSEINALQAS